MENSWLTKQIIINTEQWDNSLTTFYPETKLWMSDPVQYLKQLTELCNYLKAAKLINWDDYLINDAVLLDVGCGGGWLTGYLSANVKVKSILAIDSSANYLQNFLPSVVLKMNGDMAKVKAVQGLFSPILLDSSSVDMIVISSALHHAESIGSVLSEFKRVLKPNAYLIILNETPAGSFRYIYQIFRAFIKMVFTIICKTYQPYAQKISAGGYLYDPYLGDVDYPEWYWKGAIKASGFDVLEVIDTNLTTIAGKNGRSLKHFICKKKQL